MVEWAKVNAGRTNLGVIQPPGDNTSALGNLVGVSKVNLPAVRDSRRAQRQFPSANQGSGIGEREENVRSSNVVVVEKIGNISLEGIGVEHPSAIRNGNAELMFFIAFAMES